VTSAESALKNYSEEQDMFGAMKSHICEELKQINDNGLYKAERIITSPQNAMITIQSGQKVLNLCANNYLGLADHPDIIKAAQDSFTKWGYGLSSVRFICGTQEIHKQLEKKISEFLGTEDTILYSCCFDANTGLFETLLTAEDAIISDQLNHASIIDGIRLCKAQRLRFENSNMKDLEDKLQQAQSARFRMIATDGVFSMDGTIAKLDQICELAEKYDALVMVDDSHAVGVLGKRGRGSPEHCGVMGRIDINTGTLGKALGGASGGYTSGRKEIVEFLRQRSRPYLFSNTLAPAIVATSLKVLEMLFDSTELRDKLMDNTSYFRQQITRLGLDVIPGEHPIVPIMLGDAVLAQKMAEKLLEKGVYVIGFSYPVVPKGAARIRTQISAAHSKDDLDFVIEKIDEVKKELEI
jgi:glycine C-acetyltransferase